MAASKTFTNIPFLVKDMENHDAEKDHFNFVLRGHRFDCIFSFVENGYELLIGIFDCNVGFLIPINKRFVGEFSDKDYYRLMDVLGLKYDKDHPFTSAAFLRILSEKIPVTFSGHSPAPETMRQYRICKDIDESEKKYFCGWNDHEKDKRTARNFEKTEFYFGKKYADYCCRNNVSSLWSDKPRDSKKYTAPWDYQSRC